MAPLEKDLTGRRGERWEFDAPVAENFEEMLERSIPQYEVMRELCYELGAPYVRADADVVDLGCSRGGAIARFAADGRAARIVGLEASEPMALAAAGRFAGDPRVEVRRHDLREGLPGDLDASLVLSVLTVQFVPIEHRQRVLRDVHRRLRPGGAFVLVEKVLGDGGTMDDDLVGAYRAMKVRHGYTEEQVRRKALALEGVLVPVLARWNEEMLRRAGFAHVDSFWRCLNFCGWLAVRGD